MMSEPRLVWAVSEGEYSDYKVHALFTTEELAQQHVSKVRNGRIEQFWLFDENVSVGKLTIEVHRKSGYVTTTGELVESPSYSESYRDEVTAFGGKHPYSTIEVLAESYPQEGTNYAMWVSVWGTRKKQVEKAFQDKVAQVKAELLGI